jgi:pimeloyl-ACP methyl ester carboxylesterase
MGDSAPKGVKDMIREITDKAKACPNTKFALGGHSQGGMVTVSAIPKIPADILSRVVAVTMFGSPGCPAAVKDRCNSYCNKGDFVCDSAGKGKGGKGKFGGKGFPKGAKGPKAGGPVSEMVERSIMADECAVEEKHVARTPGNAHLAYNADGYYVKAAACYINAAYRKAGGQ